MKKVQNNFRSAARVSIFARNAFVGLTLYPLNSAGETTSIILGWGLPFKAVDFFLIKATEPFLVTTSGMLLAAYGFHRYARKNKNLSLLQNTFS